MYGSEPNCSATAACRSAAVFYALHKCLLFAWLCIIELKAQMRCLFVIVKYPLAVRRSVRLLHVPAAFRPEQVKCWWQNMHESTTKNLLRCQNLKHQVCMQHVIKQRHLFHSQLHLLCFVTAAMLSCLWVCLLLGTYTSNCLRTCQCISKHVCQPPSPLSPHC